MGLKFFILFYLYKLDQEAAILWDLRQYLLTPPSLVGTSYPILHYFPGEVGDFSQIPLKHQETVSFTGGAIWSLFGRRYRAPIQGLKNVFVVHTLYHNYCYLSVKKHFRLASLPPQHITYVKFFSMFPSKPPPILIKGEVPLCSIFFSV